MLYYFIEGPMDRVYLLPTRYLPSIEIVIIVVIILFLNNLPDIHYQ